MNEDEAAGCSDDHDPKQNEQLKHHTMKSFYRLILSAAVLATVVLPPTLRAQAPAPKPDGMPATPPTGSATTPGEAATGKTQTAAVELPEDTNAIRELTPERVKNLVERWAIKNNKLPQGGERLPFGSAVTLSLDGLTTLDADTAKALASTGFGGFFLSFNGLTTLSADTAKALGGYFECPGLSFDGLTTLSADAAVALTEGLMKKRRSWLSLNGLTTLSADTAKSLAFLKPGWLFLDGLTTLSADTAAALADYPGGLNLDGLTTLSADTAKALAGLKGDALILNGLTTLSDEAAKALAGFRGKRLSLNGLTTLSDEATKALARFKVHTRNKAEPVQGVQPAARVEEDVAFFEKKYQKKITGVKPKGEYSDPDQFYSAIAKQLGIPEIAWKAAAEKFGWKKDEGKQTFTMLKGGPTAGGGQGTWDVMFIRSTINPETKKPDPATMEQVMVQLDYDGNIKFPEIPKGNR
jgi:hypothetical protein